MAERILDQSLNGDDLTERVFKAMMAHACFLEPDFNEGVSVIHEQLADGSNTICHSLIGRSGHEKHSYGLGAVGYGFVLSEVVHAALMPATALDELSDRLPRGQELIQSLGPRTRREIAHATEVNLFTAWKFAVTSFSTEVTVAHSMRLEIVDRVEEGRDILTAVMPLDYSMSDFKGLSFIGRRRLRREFGKVSDAQTEFHIYHILHSLMSDMHIARMS